ncbi:MAG: pyridoxine 5'-phosphate synthase [Desulfobacteraceae bacterium]|nr:pyridoxine 5'-phosphate synthase [Desulfobacteraceae bacterium]MBC2754941.1 pyridoxine 5'-phosphate synthase [Desulfobacteraceae bacterium]
MAGLAVNVDHIATLRQARGINYPDPVAAAVLAELAGADGIVVHLREDRRHIQDRDVYLLRKTVLSKLILEMAATDEMIKIASDVKPDLVTLVPEKREELTTEGGLDIITHTATVEKAIFALHEQQIKVSLFIDPDTDQIKKSREINADMIEIHTGTYCDATDPAEKDAAFAAVIEAAKKAFQLNLGVNAGHGLCYNSIKRFKGLKEIDEFSIGHSIISRAAMVGMQQAVTDMLTLIKEL